VLPRAATIERVMVLWSALMTAVGRPFGSLLMA
jgi:hypothetical protein